MKNNNATGLTRLFRHYPFIIASLLLFLLCIGYNLLTRLGLFPDESAHIGFVLDVIRQNFPDYRHGLMYESNKLNYLEHPALYYIITGWYAKFLLFFHDFSYKSFRLTNYIFSTLTLLFTYRALLKMKIDKDAILFAFFPLLSIPMFIMLSASVNNDPLMILGCTIVFYAFTLIYSNDSEQVDKSNTAFIRYLLLGCTITALTKATGALVIVCLLGCFLLLDFRKVKKILSNLNRKNILLTGATMVIVVGYYGAIWHTYGNFFPSAQENPSIWYQQMNPTAPRMNLSEHLLAFYQSNLYTLLDPYGHQNFLDTIYRERLESLVLIAFPLFWFLCLLWLSKNNINLFRMNCVFSLAFIVFMAIYFYKIHALHMATGYPGAMQSRYFYGFLPFFVSIYALAFNIIKKAIIKIFIYSVFVATLIFSFYPSWSPLFSSYFGQETFNTNYGELTAGSRYEQSFTAQSSTLKKVEIKIGTYQRINKGALVLSLLNLNGDLIASSSKDMSSLVDNGWATFKFDNLELQKGSSYILRLTSDKSTAGNAITWWALSEFKELPQFQGTQQGPADLRANRYLEGLSSINGKKINGTFAFRIYK